MFKVIKNYEKTNEVIGLYEDRYEAEKQLIQTTLCTISNCDDYDYEDIANIADQGYENFGSGAIYIEEDGAIPKGVRLYEN